MPKAEPLIDRFWRKVDKSGDCWEWTAAKCSTGYGWIGIGNRKTQAAHRVVWELTYGPIPDGLCICHKCDNPGCVNPDHLFLGTYGDNMKDMWDKSRHYRRLGKENVWAKLTEDIVRQLRDEWQTKPFNMSQKARDLGIHMSTVERVVKGQTWKHL